MADLQCRAGKHKRLIESTAGNGMTIWPLADQASKKVFVFDMQPGGSIGFQLSQTHRNLHLFSKHKEDTIDRQAAAATFSGLVTLAVQYQLKTVHTTHCPGSCLHHP